MSPMLVSTAIKKANQSVCRYKISAIGLDKNGKMVVKSTNHVRFQRKGGGVHAEMHAMKVAGAAIKELIICRINNKGETLPIHPCPTCAKKAKELGIKITSIKKGFFDERF